MNMKKIIINIVLAVTTVFALCKHSIKYDCQFD